MSANPLCVPICGGIIFRARPYVNMLYGISVKTRLYNLLGNVVREALLRAGSMGNVVPVTNSCK